MLDYKRIINMHYGSCISGREIAKELNVSKTGVNQFIAAFEDCEALSFPLPAGITNYGIAKLVYGSGNPTRIRDESFSLPDCEEIHRQMATKNMTLMYQWNEYVKVCAVSGTRPYQYRKFCKLYSDWLEENRESMHFAAVIGQKMEVDFAGKTFIFVDLTTGESFKIVVFVAVLPYSGAIYAEGMSSTAEQQWIEVNNNALKFFGGVPQLVICDNCKQAVIANKDWIEPKLNDDYAEWADHNHTVILPAKVRKPKYKSTVENAVGILEKGIFHDLDKMEFHSLAEFNEQLWKLVDKVNRAPFRKESNNRYYYLEEERGALQPLPAEPYEFMVQKYAKVAPDYHITFDHARYSVDKEHLRQNVLVKATATTVKIYSMEGAFICEHPRATKPNQWMTIPENIPSTYNNPSVWNRQYFTAEAMKVGPNTLEVITRILDSRPYEVQTYRLCVGVLSFKRKYGPAVLEETCSLALSCGKPNYSFVKSRIGSVAGKVAGDQQAQGDMEVRNRGAYLMNSEKTAMKQLLARSEELINGKKGGDR